MVRRVRLTLLVVTLVVLQTTVFTHLRVFGAIPDLCLVATVAIAFEEGPQRAAVFGFVSGLFLDLFWGGPLGLWALCLLVRVTRPGAGSAAMARSWWGTSLSRRSVAARLCGRPREGWKVWARCPEGFVPSRTRSATTARL